MKKKTGKDDVQVKTFYACNTDWEFEFGECAVRFFDNIAELRKFCPCVEQCGIVEIRMEAKLVQAPDFSKIHNKENN